MRGEDFLSARSTTLVLFAIAALCALTAGSLSLEVDGEVPDAKDETASEMAVVVVDVRDNPPSYNDQSTGTPVTVAQAGDTVRWQWEGGMFHSVRSEAPVGLEPFDSGTQRLDDNDDPYVFEQTFSLPGVYKYQCDVHEAQHGLLIVV